MAAVVDRQQPPGVWQGPKFFLRAKNYGDDHCSGPGDDDDGETSTASVTRSFRLNFRVLSRYVINSHISITLQAAPDCIC